MSANTGFHNRGQFLYADEMPVEELARQYGTPLYIYSAGIIRDNITRLRNALGPDILMAFASKANTNRAILSIMAQYGLGADVVSQGEMMRAQAAGIAAEKIVFSGVGKTDGELEFAVEQGIAQINMESGAELERLIALNPQKQVRVAFRLNPDVDAKTHAKISTGKEDNKFGIPADEILYLFKSIKDHKTIKPVGLSVHIGSQLMTIDPFREAFHHLANLAHQLPDVETLDFGGGLGIVYEDETPVDVVEYARAVHEILGPLGKKLITEPGRYLVGDAGILASRVVDIKKTPGRPIVILDAGMNDLMRPALYEAIHVMRPAVEKDQKEKAAFDVVGPVCESSDVFLTNWSMTQPERGDIMALMNAGAYGMTMAGTYNTRPLPAEILVDGAHHGIIRKRQTYDDIVKDEQIPGWMNES